MTYDADASSSSTSTSTSMPRACDATVTILTPFHPKAEKYAEQVFAKVLRPGDGLSGPEAVRASDGVLLRVGAMNRQMIIDSPRLKIIARNGTGIDAIDVAACKEKGVVITNMPGGNAQAVAELALALMLAVLRRVTEVDRRLRLGQTVKSIDVLAPGLFGKTVGLVGMGDTAYETARLLSAFNCRILVYSPTSPLTRWTSSSGGADPRYPVPIDHARVEFDSLLRESDVVSLHCPLNDKTRNLIGEKELGIMKSSAVLINTARGGMVDEHALASALGDGKLGGAGIDVWVKEPPTLESMGQLAELDNVVCLPHLGGSTDQTTYDGCVGAVEIMANFFDGKGVRNRVI